MTIRAIHSAVLCSLLLVGNAAFAQQAAGIEATGSDDADHTRVSRLSAVYDFTHPDQSHYQGLQAEYARFQPSGTRAESRNRLYYRFAETGAKWKWNGTIGSDGTTVLGSATIHNEAPHRQEYFAERDMLETRQGLDRGLYYMLVGAAYDLPVDDRDIFTAMLGVQDFSGSNVRTHLRGRYIRVLDPDHGVSAQLRVRYFNDSTPREFDYYSPRWYAEVIPTLQVRRFRGGWQYLAAAGYGRSRDAQSGWRAARLVELSATSPQSRGNWLFKAGLVYTNTPITTGYTYSYTQLSLQLLRRF